MCMNVTSKYQPAHQRQWLPCQSYSALTPLHPLALLQLIMFRNNLTKPIRTLKRLSLVHIPSLIRRNLRVRTKWSVCRLSVRLAAELRHSLSIKMIRSLAILHPVDKRIQGSEREGAIPTKAVQHTGDFEVAEVVVYVGSGFFDTLVVVEAAVREDEFVTEAV